MARVLEILALVRHERAGVLGPAESQVHAEQCVAQEGTFQVKVKSVLQATAGRSFPPEEVARELEVLLRCGQAPLKEARETDQLVKAPILWVPPEKLAQQSDGCGEVADLEAVESRLAPPSPGGSGIVELAPDELPLDRLQRQAVFASGEHALKGSGGSPTIAQVVAHVVSAVSIGRLEEQHSSYQQDDQPTATKEILRGECWRQRQDCKTCRRITGTMALREQRADLSV